MTIVKAKGMIMRLLDFVSEKLEIETLGVILNTHRSLCLETIMPIQPAKELTLLRKMTDVMIRNE